MKKSFYTLSICLAMLSLSAQPEKGNLYLSGMIGFQSSSTEVENALANGFLPADPKNSSFQFAPAVGYMIDENLMAGIRFALANSKSTSTVYSFPFDPITGLLDTVSSETENRTSSTLITAFGRYYIPLGEENRFFFYPDVNIGVFSNRSETESSGTTTDGPKTNGFLIGIVPGLAFYPTPQWGIELHAGMLGFTASTTEIENQNPAVENQKNKVTNFGFAASGYATAVGISFLLNLGG
ncbi:MAG: outer membrane beta-barrel protein [Owenweeksia sp.]|nr:outer membrane beta-barrel protein [Owenweeksia sp.]